MALTEASSAAEVNAVVQRRAGRRSPPTLTADQKRKSTCANCLEKGHVAAECKKPKKGNGRVFVRHARQALQARVVSSQVSSPNSTQHTAPLITCALLCRTPPSEMKFAVCTMHSELSPDPAFSAWEFSLTHTSPFFYLMVIRLLATRSPQPRPRVCASVSFTRRENLCSDEQI